MAHGTGINFGSGAVTVLLADLVFISPACAGRREALKEGGDSPCFYISMMTGELLYRLPKKCKIDMYDVRIPWLGPSEEDWSRRHSRTAHNHANSITLPCNISLP
ncbi:hypothetical protein F4678DRAFT_48784 [Xylaria arbuscula]|nr:hypothetical protein F4678DRAFT_48784 [Xylaria arbuscula]